MKFFFILQLENFEISESGDLFFCLSLIKLKQIFGFFHTVMMYFKYWALNIKTYFDCRIFFFFKKNVHFFHTRIVQKKKKNWKFFEFWTKMGTCIERRTFFQFSTYFNYKNASQWWCKCRVHDILHPISIFFYIELLNICKINASIFFIVFSRFLH